MIDIFAGNERKMEVLDTKGNKTGELKWYKDIHRDGDWHRGAHIWIISDDGYVLLHRRSEFVHTYPGLFDGSCSGHVDIGETPLETAMKETHEELGLNLPENAFIHIGTIIDQFSYVTKLHGPCINNEFDDVFVVRVLDRNIPIKTDEREVGEVKWFSIDEIKEKFASNAPDFVPRPEEYKLLLTYINTQILKIA